MANNINSAMGAVGHFVAAHPEIAPDRVELTVQSILRWLKKQKREVTKASMDEAWNRIIDAVEAMREPESEEPVDPEIETYRKQIDSWSAAEMKEHCKNPEVLAAVEAVLNTPKPKKETPKPAAKAKATKPQLTAEELTVEKMSADAMKRALQDPVKARGIERILAAAAAKRRNGQ